MDFGSSFDQSLFEDEKESKPKQDLLSTTYEPKWCESKWFSSAVGETSFDQLQIFKFKADFLYYQKKYEEAILNYERGLSMVPANNTTMQRDIEESVARSFLKLNKYQHALEKANNLLQKSQNYDQKSTALLLLVKVYHEMGQTEDEMSVVQKCITLHPYNADLWLQLESVYRRLKDKSGHGNIICKGMERIKQDITGNRSSNDSFNGAILGHTNIDALKISDDSKNSSSVIKNCVRPKSHGMECVQVEERTSSTTEPCAQNNDLQNRLKSISIQSTSESIYRCEETFILSSSETHSESIKESRMDFVPANGASDIISFDLEILTCLVRAQILLCAKPVGSFVKERTQRLQREISEKVENMSIPGDVVEQVKKYLVQDVWGSETEDAKPELNMDQSSIESENFHLDFHRRWFAWVHVCATPQETY